MCKELILTIEASVSISHSLGPREFSATRTLFHRLSDIFLPLRENPNAKQNGRRVTGIVHFLEGMEHKEEMMS